MNTRKIKWALVSLFAAAAAVIAFRLIFGSCFLMGAVQRISVELKGVKSTNFTITVQAPGGRSYSVSCPLNAQGHDGDHYCNLRGGSFLIYEDWDKMFNGVPPDLKFTVGINDNVLESQVSPSYSASEPNGWRCPPECYSAKVVIDVSSLEGQPLR